MDYLDAEQARARLAALSELEERLSFRISRLSKLLDGHAMRQLADSPLNLTAYRILMVLSIFHEISAAELSRLMVIDRAQISRSVAALARSGLLAERPDPGSKRRKLLQMTAQGRAELAAVAPSFAARQDTIRQLLDHDELAVLTSAIDKLSRYLAQEMENPEAMPAQPRKDG